MLGLLKESSQEKYQGHANFHSSSQNLLNVFDEFVTVQERPTLKRPHKVPNRRWKEQSKLSKGEADPKRRFLQFDVQEICDNSEKEMMKILKDVNKIQKKSTSTRAPVAEPSFFISEKPKVRHGLEMFHGSSCLEKILIYNTFFDKHAESWIRNSQFELNLLCSKSEKLVHVLNLFFRKCAITCPDTILVYNTYFDRLHDDLKRVLHVLGKETVDKQDQSSRGVRNRSRDRAYQFEIWRGMYSRKPTSKLQGSLCPKFSFSEFYMILKFFLSDSFPFDSGNIDLRSNPFQEGGNDVPLGSAPAKQTCMA
uniref:Uncharacterized protein n=1 Tax=Brassica oleracea var. oleracea TaxID=109376 RepID=A0A0D2ZR73_BRAOL